MALGCGKFLRASLLCLLLVSGLLLVYPGISQSGGKGTKGNPTSRATGITLEVGEMDPQLEAALNAFGASRYDECRKLAEDLVGRAFPRPPQADTEAGTTNGGHGNARPTPDTRAECVGIIILSHLDQGDFDAARAAADRLRTISPEVCQDLLAQVSREERDYQARVAQLQHIVATTKDLEEAARAQLATGTAHDVMGCALLATESYRKVIDRYPHGVPAARALHRVVGLCLRQGKSEEGLAAVRNVLETHSDRAYLAEAATTEIARHFALMETRGECISYLEQFARDHEGTEGAAYAVLAAGRLHVAGNEPALAEEAWNSFLVDSAHQRASASRVIEDELTQLHVQLARAVRKEGRDADAMRFLEQAVSNPRWPLLCREAGSELADAYEAAGRYDDAVAMLRRLQRDERGQRAVFLLRFREASALRRGGRAQEAARSYQELMKAASDDERLRAACLAGLAFTEDDLAPTR